MGVYVRYARSWFARQSGHIIIIDVADLLVKDIEYVQKHSPIFIKLIADSSINELDRTPSSSPKNVLSTLSRPGM